MPFTRGAFLAASTAGTAVAFTPGAVRAQIPTIRMGQNANDVFGEGYYGVDQGIFSAAGLNVVVTTFQNGAAQAAAAAGGAIDVGLGEGTELANGIVRGLPFVAIAGGAFYDSGAPVSALVTAADGPIRSAKDFQGQTIAVSALQSEIAFATKAWLAQNGADVTNVNFVELPQPAMAAAVTRGTVQGAHLGEPFLSAAAGTVRKIGAPNDAVGKLFLINEWFATKDWLAANVATARKLVTAIYDTAKWANANRDASAVILAKYAKLDLDRIHTMTRTRYATSLDPQMIQPVLDLGFAYKALPRKVSASEMLVRS